MCVYVYTWKEKRGKKYACGIRERQRQKKLNFFSVKDLEILHVNSLIANISTVMQEFDVFIKSLPA